MTTIERFETGPRMSRAVRYNGVVTLSGLTADDAGQDISGQTLQVLQKAERKLALAGTNKSRLISATILLSDIADFDAMNAVWETWIDKDEPPARATAQCRLAHPDLRIEILFTAAV